jgi:predicted HTH transcriptional regulator
MRNIQIETKVLEIVDQIREDRPIEDATVELKAEWPTDISKASRQLAGHANAARGEEILWIIGIDEKNRAIPGANKVELANWIPQIESRFDDIAPNLSKDLLVSLENGESVVALLFETGQAPYVVKYHKDPNFLEVPW